MTDQDEITVELTDYCPHGCKYCSSGTTTSRADAKYIKYVLLESILSGKHFKRIILSGGEPLSHPFFYDILQLAKRHADDVVVYTNEFTHLCYNANVIDGIYVAANLTVNESTGKVKILKRVEQGREASRPEVSFSGNFDGRCPCSSPVILPDGSVAPNPCNKGGRVDVEDSMKEQLRSDIAKMDEFNARMKWICDACGSDFAEPLNLDFGVDEGWVCPFCNSKDVREKHKST